MDIIKSKIKRNETQCKSSIIITHLPYVYLIILPCKVPEKSVTKFYNEKKENWTNKERKKRNGLDSVSNNPTTHCAYVF